MKFHGFKLVFFGACCAVALMLMAPGARSSAAPTAEDDEAHLAMASAVTDLWGVHPVDTLTRSRRATVNMNEVDVDRPVVPFIGTYERNRAYNYWWVNSNFRSDKDVLTYQKYHREAVERDFGGPHKFPVTLFDKHHRPQPVLSTRRIGNYIYSSCRRRDEDLFTRRCRRRLPESESGVSLENQPVEEVLNLSEEMKRVPSMEVLPILPSTNQSLIAFATDKLGDHKYDIRVRSVETGQDILPTPLTNTNGEMAWSDDSKHLYYVTLGTGLSPDMVWRLNVDNPLSTPHLVYYEPDKKFQISLSRTLSNKLILITSTSPFESEIRYIKADHSFTVPRLIVPRDTFMFYQLFERNGELIVLETDNYDATSTLAWVNKTDVDEHGSGNNLWDYANVLATTSRDTIDQVVVSSKQIVALVAHHGEGSLRVWKYPIREPISAKAPDKVKIYDVGAVWRKISFPTDFNMPVLRVESSSIQAHYLVQEISMATYTRTIIEAGHADIPSVDKDSVANLFTQLDDSCGGGRVSYAYRKDMFQRNGRAPMVLFAVDSDSGPLGLMEQAQDSVLLDMGFVIGRMTVHPHGFVTNSTCTAEGPEVQMRSTVELVAAIKQLVARKVTSHDRVIVVAARRGTTAVLDAVNWYTRLVAGVIVTQPITDLVYEMSDTRPIDFKVPYGPHSRSTGVPEYDAALLNSPIDGMQRKPYPPMLMLADATDTNIGNWQATKYMALLATMEPRYNLKWLYTSTPDDVQLPFERRKIVQKDQIQFMLHVLGLRTTPSTMVAPSMYARPIGKSYFI